MPSSKPFSLSGMVDTDVEEDVSDADPLASPDSNQENKATKKQGGRTKAPAKKATRAKRTSDGPGAAMSAPVKQAKGRGKRAVQKEDPKLPNGEITDEADEFAQPDLHPPAAQSGEGRKNNKRKAPEKAAGRPAKSAKHTRLSAKDGEFEYTPTAQQRHSRPTNKGRPQNTSAATVEHAPTMLSESEVPETQAATMADSPVPAANKGAPDIHDQATSIVRQSHYARVPTKARAADATRRRAGSASDTDRAMGEPNLRRRLGDMTRKFENLDMKFRALRDVGIKEAEANYEKLRKQSETNSKAANDLIDSLKKDLAAQKAIAQESQFMQSQAQQREADLSKTRALADQLSKSLADVQNDNKVLQAKLANTRSTSTAPDRTPGSAMKSRPLGQSRTGSNEASNSANASQLKEELYSDLTGLIIRSVDSEADADYFDCIQTGRNGTLHFKLAVSKDPDETYENTEFSYTPRLDSGRDRALIELLPEYLNDDIVFSRMNAAMFYGRVQETLTKR